MQIVVYALITILIYFVSLRLFLRGRDGITKRRLLLGSSRFADTLAIFLKAGPDNCIFGKKAKNVGVLFIFFSLASFSIAALYTLNGMLLLLGYDFGLQIYLAK